MSQTAVLESVTKTSNEYQGMYRHDIKFRNDPTTYIVWRSEDRAISFKPGDTVNYEVTDAGKKKIKFLKSPQSAAPKSSGYSGARSADTNKAISAQTMFKVSGDFFKDRPDASLEDVADGAVYLHQRYEAYLKGNTKTAETSRPAIPTDFLNKLP